MNNKLDFGGESWLKKKSENKINFTISLQFWNIYFGQIVLFLRVNNNTDMYYVPGVQTHYFTYWVY